MEESILKTIKPLLGVDVDYDAFDLEIITGINSAIMSLNQIGVGTEGFRITGPDETWNDLLEGRDDLEQAKTYIQLKTKLIFDPPTSSAAIDAIKETLKEYEWRLYEQAQEWE